MSSGLCGGAYFKREAILDARKQKATCNQNQTGSTLRKTSRKSSIPTKWEILAWAAKSREAEANRPGTEWDCSWFFWFFPIFSYQKCTEIMFSTRNTEHMQSKMQSYFRTNSCRGSGDGDVLWGRPVGWQHDEAGLELLRLGCHVSNLICRFLIELCWKS